MATQPLQVCIADEDQIMTAALKNDLEQTFGSNIRITVFNDAKRFLEKLTDDIHLVILAYDFKKRSGPENGVELLKFIKKTHPLTEVVMHSSNDDIRVVLRSIRTGAKSYIIKDTNSFSRVREIIRKRFTEPIRKLITEFGVNKFVIIFITTFLVMGIVVYISLHKRF